jgi:hypothetical protein
VSLRPQTDLRYCHRKNDNEFSFDTEETKRMLNGVPINNAEVISFLKQYIEEGLSEI